MEFPKISILIPTLNSSGVLTDCLKSIASQEYPKDKIEIIVADGGSSDGTVNTALGFGAITIENKLKTGEAGKMCALRKSTGEYIALIDSDNILPDKNWLKQMVEPLEVHKDALGSEPMHYTWRKEDGFISRYCALIGMNDPMVMFLGNYDRFNLITGKWTEVPHEEEKFEDYIKATFAGGSLPTIGANGTVFRSEFIKKFTNEDYLFDIDILYREMRSVGKVTFIKVKNGIIHTFCESDIKKFVRKQVRRVRDYLFFRNGKTERAYNWESVGFGKSNPLGLLKFILSCLTVFPLFVQTLIGFSKKPDVAWFFHPLACEITFFVYSWHVLFGTFYRKELSREGWKQ